MPWHVPEDLAHFKELTLGVDRRHGPRDLGRRCRPAVDRCPAGATSSSPGSRTGRRPAPSWPRSLAEALDQPGDVWVIGGASVYRDALPLADVVVVTELAQAFDGDTRAPELGPAWRVRDHDPATGWLPSRTGLDHRVVTYVPSAAVTSRDLT